MRSLVLAVLVLASCDLKPQKRDATQSAPATTKVQEPAAAPAAPAAPAQPTPVPSNGSGSAAVPPKPSNSDECVAVGVHIANIVIASIEDPAVKAAQEQDRTKLVNRVAETCTRDKWSDTARACFLAGKTAQALEECGRTLAAP